MPILNLTPEQKKVVASWVETQGKEDLSSKDMFSMAFQAYKPFKGQKAAIGNITKGLNKAIADVTKVSAFQTRAKRIFKLAHDYCTFDFLTKFDELYFYNIGEATKLATAVSQDTKLQETELKAIAAIYEVPDTVWAKEGTLQQQGTKLIREILKSVWPSLEEQTTVMYNNRFEEVVKEIRGELNYVDTEGEFKKFKTKLTELVEDLDINQLEELEGLLMPAISAKRLAETQQTSEEVKTA